MKPGEIPVIDTESPEHTREPTPEEKVHETPVSSDQTTPATLSIDVNEEQVDDEEKKVMIELKKPSSCKNIVLNIQSKIVHMMLLFR